MGYDGFECYCFINLTNEHNAVTLTPYSRIL